MLDSQRLGARPYSVSALQKFATCPYQFVLAAIYRFAPNDPPEPLQRLDPLTRGSLFHEVQASVLRTLHAANRLPLTVEGVPSALQALAVALDRTASAYKERLAPAIERVWHDEIAALGRDLRVWIRKLPESAPWTPEYFEYSFGLADEGRDAAQSARSRANRRPFHSSRLRRHDRNEDRVVRTADHGPQDRP